MKRNDLFWISALILIILIAGCAQEKTAAIRSTKKVVEDVSEPVPEPVVDDPVVEDPEEEQEAEDQVDESETEDDPEPEPEPEDEPEDAVTATLNVNNTVNVVLDMFDIGACHTRINEARKKRDEARYALVEAWLDVLDTEREVKVSNVKVDIADDRLDAAQADGTENEVESAKESLDNAKDNYEDNKFELNEIRDDYEVRERLFEDAKTLLENEIMACKSDITDFTQEMLRLQAFNPTNCRNGEVNLRRYKKLLEEDLEMEDIYVLIAKKDAGFAEDAKKVAEDNEAGLSDPYVQEYAEVDTDIAKKHLSAMKTKMNKAEDDYEQLEKLLDVITSSRSDIDDECGDLDKIGVELKSKSQCEMELTEADEEVEDAEQELSDEETEREEAMRDLDNAWEKLIKATSDLIDARKTHDESAISSAEVNIDVVEKTLKNRQEDLEDSLDEEYAAREVLKQKQDDWEQIRISCHS